jgi:hypothetical protein
VSSRIAAEFCRVAVVFLVVAAASLEIFSSSELTDPAKSFTALARSDRAFVLLLVAEADLFTDPVAFSIEAERELLV